MLNCNYQLLQRCAGIFRSAGIQCKVVVTGNSALSCTLLQVFPLCTAESADHCDRVLASSSLAGLDGVISVGGDGMFAQVFNGLLMRVARDAGVEVEARDGLLIILLY